MTMEQTRSAETTGQTTAALAQDTTASDDGIHPAEAPEPSPFLVTRLTASRPDRLTKRFELAPSGELVTQSGGQLIEGEAKQIAVADLDAFKTLLEGLSSNQALAYGIAEGYPEARVVTQERQREGDGSITRTRRYFGYRRWPGIMMLDHDAKSEHYSPQDLIETLRRIAPSLADAAMLWRASASSGIVRDDTGEELTGLRGQRIFLLVQDAALIPEAGRALIDLCWANRLGRVDVGAAGQALERTLFDASVWQPERMDFAATPVLGSGLSRRVPESFIDGDPASLFDLRRLIAQADLGVISRAEQARKEARERKSPELEQAREAWLDERAPALAERQGLSVDEARTVLGDASRRQQLSPAFVLKASDGREVRVQELLDNPEQWHGQRFADPLDPEYHQDPRIAWANLRSGGQPCLFSHAHGGRSFVLMRPTRRIQLHTGHRDQAVDDTLELLQARGELFEYGEAIARVTPEGSVRVIEPHWMLDHLDRVGQYFTIKVGDDGVVEKPADAPLYVAQRILAKQGERGLAKLDAVITAPTLRSDGSLLNEPGYDHGSQLLLSARTPDLPYIPEAPTLEQAAAALDLLWRPFSEFPLVDAIDQGVILAAILTAIVRPSLPTAPGFGIDAPTAGTGKTLLGQAIGALLLGVKPAALPPAGNQDDETRKRLFAALRGGTKVLLWDNVRDPLGNAALDAFLTAATFSDRVLGASETLALPNRALFLTTGNSLRLVGDTCRRLLIARLDAQIEKPYAREFDWCPLEMVISRRQELVAAGLTLMRAYIASGRHRLGAGRTASFEAWDDLVRQTVCWVASWDARFADPLRATERAYDDDPDTNHLGSLVHAWYAFYGDSPVTVEQLASPPYDVRGQEPEERTAARNELNDALQAVSGDHRGISNRVLGKWIAKHKERRIDGLRIVQHGNPASKSKRSKKWCVVADEAYQPTAEAQRGVLGSERVHSGPQEIVTGHGSHAGSSLIPGRVAHQGPEGQTVH